MTSGYKFKKNVTIGFEFQNWDRWIQITKKKIMTIGFKFTKSIRSLEPPLRLQVSGI